ncbi:MAG: NAD(P)H-binding protein [Tabrizicola sp.]|nr:NAD(P)H-binding protein [Tabrizicola sp.]
MHLPPAGPPHILILGAYGLIGAGIARHLVSLGYPVTGFGRNAAVASRVLPGVPVIVRDMATLTRGDDWGAVLDGVTAVVNCAGALQDGREDDLEALHHHAVAALAEACAARGVRLVQISAVGARADAATGFLATKGRGDAAIRASGAPHQIFRPGLVLAPHGYGGSALLRMLAAVPVVQPVAMAEARIQTVALADLAEAVRPHWMGGCPMVTRAIWWKPHRMRCGRFCWRSAAGLALVTRRWSRCRVG